MTTLPQESQRAQQQRWQRLQEPVQQVPRRVWYAGAEQASRQEGEPLARNYGRQQGAEPPHAGRRALPLLPL